MGLKNPVNIMEPEDVGGPIPEWLVRPDREEAVSSVQEQQNDSITAVEPGETSVERRTPFA